MAAEEPRPEKVAVVDEVRGRLSSSSAALLTEYRGLNVRDLAALRSAVRDAGGEYKIYKNTLVRLAARDLELEELEQLLTGPTAIAFVEGDAVVVAKSLRDFSRTNPSLVIKGGILGRSVLSAADAGALADVAPREVLLAQFAGALAAPLRQMAGLLAALPRNFAYGLKALIDERGAEGDTAVPEETAAPVDTAAPDDTAGPPAEAATDTLDLPAAPDDTAGPPAEAAPDTTDMPAAPDDTAGPPAEAATDTTDMPDAPGVPDTADATETKE